MKEKLLHTPEGVRDIYHAECKRKKALEDRMHQVLSLYGYQDIETPTFEFFDVFNSDTGTANSREMFKFFDRDNNTLVLRPDMTPSIARSVAKYYSDCMYPLRLCYVGNTFINNHSYQGKLTEKTEMGAEHINDDSPEADAEAIVMMIDCFLAAGLTDFRIDIGETEFYRGIMDALDVSDEVKAKIHDYIENKNSLGMEILLADLPMKECYRKILLEYNDLYGDASMLLRARELTINPRCRAAVERLEQVYEAVCEYGYERYISFDLGMVNHYEYYTGIIFRGYTYGTGDAIAKGGRYDNLLLQFGKNAPAIGFTILVDDLLSAMERQQIEIPIQEYDYSVLLYEKKNNQEAVKLACELRRKGIRTELTCLGCREQPEERIRFLRFQGAQRIFILRGDTVTICDAPNEEQKEMSLCEFREVYTS